MTSKVKVQSVELGDLVQDRSNLNQHAERGSGLTRKSIERFGARLAGVVDKNNTIIDGNDRQIAYGEVDFDKVLIVEADPNVPVYLRYADLDLTDPTNPARELQLALHRSAVESWTLDTDALLAAMQDGLNPDGWFTQAELEDLHSTPPTLDQLHQQYGEPDPSSFWPIIRVQVSPEVKERYDALLADLEGEDEATKFAQLLERCEQ